MSTTISTKNSCAGLLGSKWATKPSESTARKTTSTTGLLKSRWAPKSTTTTTTTTEPKTSSPQAPEATTTITTTPAEPEQKTKPEDTREPLLELLPATTVQPYQKKSWADLVDDDDDEIVFNLPELNKENFPPRPDTTTEATVTVPMDDKENLPPTPKDNGENIQPQPEDEEQTTTTKQAPASMLSSRWSDASYEIQGAQTRAEYRATHGSPTNNARRNNNRRRRAN